MRSLFKKPATLMYPIKPREWTENTRGCIEIDIESCIFCGICVRKCPTDALTVDRDAKSWTIARMGCIQCSCCVDVCPKKCLENIAGYTSPGMKKVVDTFVKQPEPEPEPAAEPELEPEAEAEPEPEAAAEPDPEPEAEPEPAEV